MVIGLLFSNPGRADGDPLSWTVLIPQNDSRAREVRDHDEYVSKIRVLEMNKAMELTKIFPQPIIWNCISIDDLLKTQAPFCELRFDAVNPLVLTGKEKSILQEYLMRGGFILFEQDFYPYSQDECCSVTSWPIIDFLFHELPASNAAFKFERIPPNHLLYHQCYNEKPNTVFRPYFPEGILGTYRQQPCTFVIGRYFLDKKDGKDLAEPKPYRLYFNAHHSGYRETVNIYVYAMTH